jgi:hypothetical protein
MTATIARLILAMLILPATGAVFLLTFLAVLARSGGGGPPPFWGILVVWIIVYTFVAAYWILLWRSTVRWTAARIWKTALAGAVALAGGGAIAFAVIVISRSQIPPGIALLLGGGTVPIVWVLGTVLLWRETAAERVARMSNLIGSPTVVCPFCGYNLSGLREARCPECGNSFTLDQLAASQPQRNEHLAEL